MELFINGHSTKLNHKPVTLRNAETLTEWAKRMRDHVVSTNDGAQKAFFVELMNRHPDLLDVMTIDGGINPKAVESYIERERLSIERHNQNLAEGEEAITVTDEQLQTQAIDHVQTTVQNMMKDSPAIARIIQFTMPEFGTDLSSLRLGIECIIATYNDAVHSEEINTAIKDASGEHWMDVTGAEVATYVNTFLRSCS